MKHILLWLLFFVLVMLVVAQQPPLNPQPASPRPAIDPCAPGETPCDPQRPWMRGRIEKSCAAPSELARLRKQSPGREILECHCQHTCDPFNEYAEVTNNRAWDALCQARCNTGNCACEHPCAS